jgi:hypothetical protein
MGTFRASRWCAVGSDAAERVLVGTATGQHQFTKRVSCGHAGALGTRVRKLRRRKAAEYAFPLIVRGMWSPDAG